MKLKQTPLFNKHIEAKARMAPFAGFDMPISYDQITGGMIKEHLAVRKSSGIFDISHMGEFWIEGPGASDFMSWILSRPTHNLSTGRALYALILNSAGGIVDDIITYKFDSSRYWLVVNASNIEKVDSHIREQAQKFNVKIRNMSADTALIAIQGPKAKELVPRLFPNIDRLKYYSFEQQGEFIIGRTGYTGEDGFEIFSSNQKIADLWDQFISWGSSPIGLGARDTLRLEAGFPLYGHELTDETGPLETLAAFAFDPKHPCFGSEQALKLNKRVSIAVKTDNPRPLRLGQPLFRSGKQIGTLTSGSMSPILRSGIGIGLVSLEEPISDSMIFALDASTNPRQAVFTFLPFVDGERTKKRVAEGSLLKVKNK